MLEGGLGNDISPVSPAQTRLWRDAAPGGSEMFHGNKKNVLDGSMCYIYVTFCMQLYACILYIYKTRQIALVLGQTTVPLHWTRWTKQKPVNVNNSFTPKKGRAGAPWFASWPPWRTYNNMPTCLLFFPWSSGRGNDRCVCVCVSKKQRHFKTPKWIKWIQFQLPLTLDIQANTVPFGPPKPTHQTPFTSRSVFAWMSGGSFPYGFFLPCKASNIKNDSKLECFIYTKTELSESRKTMVTPPKSPTGC